MINRLVAPSSIAIVGASQDHKTISGRVLLNLLRSKFSGNLFVVNPKYDEVLGMPSYHSLLDIADDVDLACIIVPLLQVPHVLRDCVRKGVTTAVIFSSEVLDPSPEGLTVREEIRKVLDTGFLRVMGPFGPSIFNFREKWGLSFSLQLESHRLIEGSIGLLTQGISLGQTILDANEKGIGFSYWFSSGLELDLNINDFLEWMIQQEETNTILMILESVPEPDRFLRQIHAAKRNGKPLVLLKIGKTAPSLEVIGKARERQRRNYSVSLFNHPAIIMVDNPDEMLGVGWLLTTHRHVPRGRTLIYSWGYDVTAYLTDLCEKYNVYLPPLSEALKAQLGVKKPSSSDEWRHSLHLYEELFKTPDLFIWGIEKIIHSGEYDVLLIPIPFKNDSLTEDMARFLVEFAQAHKSVLLIPIFLSTGDLKGVTYEIIRDSGIPYFTHPETAIKCLARYLQYKMASPMN